jgi:hypothetical protein
VEGDPKVDDALTSFFYQLMRDHVPVGKVARMIEEMEDSDSHMFLLSNQHLAAYARECVARLHAISEGPP